MKKIFLTTAFIVACHVTFCIASPSIDQAKRFINEFLEAEFDGQQDFRDGNAIYSPEREKLIKKLYGPTLRVVFYWESEELCVVDDYRVTNVEMTDSTAVAEVTCQECGCTGARGYGRSPLIKTSKESTVKYILKYKKGRWWVYDPPIPRVSRKVIVDHNNGIIGIMKKFVMEEGTEIQKEYYFNLINTNKMLEQKCGEKKSTENQP